MKNKLEEFVNRNRESFDSEMPDHDLWKEIDKEPVKESKVFNLLTRTQAAAVLLVLVNATIIFFLLQRKPEASQATSTSPASTEQVTGKEPVSEDALDQISRVIEVKQAKLKEIERSNPVLYKKFIGALDQLNDAYKDLEKKLDSNPNKEQLLDAMIQNLSLQQELLNQQLSIYQKIKQQKNEKISKNI
ncbi:MAG: hypothetical protein V4557_01730 [Bacteroidota bacterium]